MAQNATITLTVEQTRVRDHYAALLATQVGVNVVVCFDTREGERRTVYGEVAEVVQGATPDKGCVRIMSPDGYKSANLWRIHSVTIPSDEERATEADREEAHKRATVGW